jgi:LacI family transcriptional regulator
VAAELEIGIRAALEHLTQQGCQKIGYFAPDIAIERPGDPRYDVYCQVMREYGYPARLYAYDGSAFDMQAARERAERIGCATERPDALLCFNDMAAMGALMGLRRAGLHVPEEIALVGCDDLPLAAQLDVSLTTVAYPLADMCRIAVEMLLERIASRDQEGEPLPARTCLLPTELRIRESSCFSPQENHIVVKSAPTHIRRRQESIKQ